MKRSRILILVLAVLLVFALTACSQNEEYDDEYTGTSRIVFEVDGAVYGELDVDDGSIFMPEEPVKTGYKFNGWIAEGNGDVLTFRAQWVKSDEEVLAEYDGTYTRDGDAIYMGTYPQSEVKDEDILSALANTVTELPTAYGSGAWTSYDYILKNKNTTKFMWYLDVELDGEMYRGVYFTKYRPLDITYSASNENSYQDDNGYVTAEIVNRETSIYWFKYEPIKWRILEEADGTLLLLCDTAIDSQNFYSPFELTNSEDEEGIDAEEGIVDGEESEETEEIYRNNYAQSYIRAWLNINFYQTAFNDYQKGLIQKSHVDNGVSSTGYKENPYISEDTEDNVFLLSYAEVTSLCSEPQNRQVKSSDYARSQGCFTSENKKTKGNCQWWLRSPILTGEYSARIVGVGGDIYNYGVTATKCGIVPAIRINLNAYSE